MNTQEKVKTFINKNLTLNRLLIVIMSLVTLYLLMLTEGFWIYAFGKLQSILMPFIIGFGIAYILHPITKYFENKENREMVEKFLALPNARFAEAVKYEKVEVARKKIAITGKFGKYSRDDIVAMANETR